MAQQPLLNAELRWRRDAVLDPLTGLLNRQGLPGRFREVAEQARLTDAPVSLVMCDLDGFKGLNDEHGHACGDAVLKDVAYVLRKELRSFELLYRIGGEELLLMLPGAGLERAARWPKTFARRSSTAGLRACGSPHRWECARPTGTTSSSGRCSTPPTARCTTPNAAVAIVSPTRRTSTAIGRCSARTSSRSRFEAVLALLSGRLRTRAMSARVSPWPAGRPPADDSASAAPSCCTEGCDRRW